MPALCGVEGGSRTWCARVQITRLVELASQLKAFVNQNYKEKKGRTLHTKMKFTTPVTAATSTADLLKDYPTQLREEWH